MTDQEIFDAIILFGKECDESEYTDTDLVWDLLHAIADEMLLRLASQNIS